MSLPDAWEECKNSTCPAAAPPVKNPGKDTYKVDPQAGAATTCNIPCACRLFSAPKTDTAGNETWSWESNPQNVYEADKKQFKWICVKPVIDDEDHVICASGACVLSEKDVKEGGRVIETWVRCTKDSAAPCSDPCLCKLYKLIYDQAHPDKKRDEKWKPEKQPAKRDPDYSYICLCVKTP